MVIIIAAVLLSASTAAAQPATWAKQASEHYHAGRFFKAVVLLEKAYRVRPEPVLLYNIARCWDSAGLEDRALEVYQRYLKVKPQTKKRALVLARIETLERKKQERQALLLAATRNPPPAPAPTPTPPPKVVPNDASPPPDLIAGTNAPPPKIKAWPLAVVGTGLLTLGVGATLGAVAQDKISASQRSTVHRDALLLDAEGRDFATAANATLIIGGVVTAVGAAAFAWDLGWFGSSNANASQVKLQVGPTGVLAQVRL